MHTVPLTRSSVGTGALNLVDSVFFYTGRGHWSLTRKYHVRTCERDNRVSKSILHNKYSLQFKIAPVNKKEKNGRGDIILLTVIMVIGK